MTVLVTGAGGQVGQELVRVLGDDGVGLSHAQLDVTDRDAVRTAVKRVKPDAVIHAAAWTAVDACEDDPERAQLANGTATGYVAEAAAEVGARLCYLSTDYVFDGEQAAPYQEDDRPNPQSVYGQSKLAGELAAGPDALIVRISWVCGFHGGNMVKTVLRLSAEHDTLTFVDDQRGRPTFADELAGKLVELLDRDVRGLVHVTNQGTVSWYGFAREILELTGQDPDRVRPVTSAEFVRPAPRPKNSVLAAARLYELGIPRMGHHRFPLRRLLRQLGH
jgi:dTDP-4-dehydrorhamnose reductase